MAQMDEFIAAISKYPSVKDVPTEKLATNFVCELIRAKGDLSKYQLLTEMLIRELRGEPHPLLSE